MVMNWKPDHSNSSEKISLKYSVCNSTSGSSLKWVFRFPSSLRLRWCLGKDLKYSYWPQHMKGPWRSVKLFDCVVWCNLPTLCVIWLNSPKLNKLHAILKTTIKLIYLETNINRTYSRTTFIENKELLKSNTAVLKRIGAGEQHVKNLKTVDDCMFEMRIARVNSRVVRLGTLVLVLWSKWIWCWK